MRRKTPRQKKRAHERRRWNAAQRHAAQHTGPLTVRQLTLAERIALEEARHAKRERLKSTHRRPES